MAKDDHLNYYPEGYGPPVVKWSPKHDQVVALRLAGYDVMSICATTGYSDVQVRRILKNPRAKKAMEAARERMLGKFLVGIQDQMVSLGPRALKNIAQTIRQDTEVGTKAKVHQDNVSFELLSRLGFSKKASRENGDGVRGALLDRDMQERLVTALEKSNKAREIHANAEEVEYEEVDD